MYTILLLFSIIMRKFASVYGYADSLQKSVMQQ